MRRTRTARSLKQNLQPAQLLKRYHRRTRRKVPWLQTLVLALLLPLLSFVSRVRISGRENIPDGGYIAAANHLSNFDALFVALAIRRRIRFMGKSELFDGRWGWLLNRLGGFPVQRGVWDADAFETAATVLNRGRVMSMFPEGGVHRRSRAGEIRRRAHRPSRRGDGPARLPRRNPFAVHAVALAEGPRRRGRAASCRGGPAAVTRAVPADRAADPRRGLRPRLASESAHVGREPKQSAWQARSSAVSSGASIACVAATARCACRRRSSSSP